MPEKKDKHFIKKPVYPGGQEAFKKFIAANLKYPKEAAEKGIEGTVVLKYAIDYKGKVSDVKVIKGLGHGCDEEAKRVISLLRFEIPSEPRKLKVLFHKETKIFFHLPKRQAPPKKTTGLQYTFVPSSKKESVDKDKTDKKVYSYTVKI